ncbi:MAG: enoyl-CoA hydratase/isomerase family protein [Deferribacterales bacterium]|nr:enoyl-CoA hydratase/isomerase family protein [Deferribacterales bacterium]
MEYKFLKVAKTEKILTITINRPEALNALNKEVLKELECALYDTYLNEDIRVVVLTGEGEKAFVAGADIKEMQNMNTCQAIDFAKKGHDILRLIRKMPQPVIAAVNGYALGGGFEMALACDIIFASSNAKFGFPEVTLGIMPGFGGTQNLSRIVGEKIASELIFTGKMITAQRGKELNIVSEVFENKEKLMENVYKTCEQIVSNSKLGIKFAKEAILNGINMPINEAYNYESSLFGGLFSTEDQKEGMKAFVEKRKAQFKGA